MFSVYIFAILIFGGCAHQYTVIHVAKSAPSFILRSNDRNSIEHDVKPLITLKVYLDLLCPDSKASYANLKNLVSNYTDNRYKIDLHFTVLPYHKNSFIAFQMLHLLSPYLNNEGGLKFVDTIFNNMDSLHPRNTILDTEAQTLRKLALLVFGLIRYDSEFSTVDKLIERFASARWPAALSWKYNVSRGIAGTPWNFINDIMFKVNGVTISEKTYKLAISKAIEDLE